MFSVVDGDTFADNYDHVFNAYYTEADGDRDTVRREAEAMFFGL